MAWGMRLPWLLSLRAAVKEAFVLYHIYMSEVEEKKWWFKEAERGEETKRASCSEVVGVYLRGLNLAPGGRAGRSAKRSIMAFVKMGGAPSFWTRARMRSILGVLLWW